jgi:hypothetical protein
MMSQLY